MKNHSNSIISFNNVGFAFEKHHYFHNFDLSIEKGETFILFGPSNSGKSFFLRLILGLVQPSSGAVIVENYDIADLFPDKIYDFRRRIAFVSRDSDLINNLTVYNNIALSLDFHSRLKSAAIDKKVKELLKALSLESYSQMRPFDLHEDIKKKVAFARAIIVRPDIFQIGFNMRSCD